jgi:hypothetical protein
VLLLAMVASWATIVMLLLKGSCGLDGPVIIAYCVSVLGFLGALAILIEAIPRVWRGPGGWCAAVRLCSGSRGPMVYG